MLQISQKRLDNVTTFGYTLQEGMSEDELLETTTWTGSTPMHGVLIDGVAQD